MIRLGDRLRDTNRNTVRPVVAIDEGVSVRVERRGGGTSRIAWENLRRYRNEGARVRRPKNWNDPGSTL